MAVPTHFKFVFRGTFVGTEEEWSFSVKFRRDIEEGGDAGLGDINQSTVTAAASALIGTAGTARFAQTIALTEWRAYVIGTNGRMEGNPLLVELATPVNGQSAAVFPPQIALCVTTVATNRGPARFGRFFLPAPVVPMEDWRISIVNANVYADVVSAFLKGVSDGIDLPLTPDSSSALNISALPAPDGTKQIVDHVEVGRVLDTIQSRRRQLLEERVVDAQIDW